MDTETQKARDGLDFIVENSEYVRKLASALNAVGPDSLGVRKQMFELLAALCAHNEDGRQRALETLEYYKKLKGERYRLNFVVQELELAKAIDYQTALLAFINCLIISTPKLMDRIRLRNEFIGCHLLPVLNNLRKYAEAEPDIAVQLDVFDEQRESDEAEYLQESHGVDLNSPLDVFYAILKQVAGTPQEMSFLSILQHLLRLDPKEAINDIIWDTTEKLVHQATLIEKKDDVPKLLRSSSIQSKLFCHCLQKSDAKISPDKKQSGQFNSPLSPVRIPPAPPMFAPPPPPPPPNISAPPPMQPSSPNLSDQYLVNSSVPGTSTVNEPGVLKLPQQEIPAPKSKMKTINWNKIPSNKVIGKNNIWTQVAGRHEHSPLTDMNWSEIEGLFCQQTLPSGHASPKPLSCDPVDERKKIRKESQEIALLDGKRSLNVNIFLKQFRSSNEEITRLIKNGDYIEIGPEKLKGLLKILPEVDELDMLKSFNGDFAKLGNAEKFLIQLTNLPNYKLRIESMLLKDEFASNMSYLAPSINSMILAAQDLMTNKPLQEVLYMILVAGNFLNAGGYAGDAAGIKLSSLQKLTEIRANKPNMSLIHYVASHAEKKNKLLLSFTENINVLEDAAKSTVEQLNNEINALDVRIKKVKKQIELPTIESEIKEQMTDFLMTAEKEVFDLQKELRKLDKVRRQLADFFCEDPSSFKIEECFRVFHGFTSKFKQAVAENERRRILEEQAIARKRQREEILAIKRKQMECLGAPDEMSFIDLQIYDPRAYLKKNLKSQSGGEISEDDVSITSGPSLSRKRLGSLGSGAENNTEKDERSPDTTPNGSIRRRKSRVLSDEDGNLMDFLRGSGDNKRKSWGSLDRSWARKARGNGQRKRPALLGADFLSERERASSPSPLSENKPISSGPEEEYNSKEWQQQIESWLQANSQDQVKDEQILQTRKLNNRKSIELDSESERSSALDTLPEGRQVYSGKQSYYRKEYPSWKPSAALDNMDIVGVIETVEEAQPPRVKDKSAWRKSTLNVANSTEEIKENNPRTRYTVPSVSITSAVKCSQETNDRKGLISSLAEEPATDKLTLYIRKPSEFSDQVVPSDQKAILDTKQLQKSDSQTSITTASSNKVEIDQDNVETPPATRKVFIHSTHKREPVQPSPCKRAWGIINNKEDEMDGAMNGNGQFNRFSPARRTRRQFRQGNDVKHQRGTENQTDTRNCNTDLPVDIPEPALNNRSLIRDFVSPTLIKDSPIKLDNLLHTSKEFLKEKEFEEPPNLISEFHNQGTPLEEKLITNNIINSPPITDGNLSKNIKPLTNMSTNINDTTLSPKSNKTYITPGTTQTPSETNPVQISRKNSIPQKRIPLSRLRNFEVNKRDSVAKPSEISKENNKSIKTPEIQKSNSRNSLLSSQGASAALNKTIGRLPIRANNVTNFNNKEPHCISNKTSTATPPNSTVKSTLKRQLSKNGTSARKPLRPQDLSFMKPTTSSTTKISTSFVKKNTSTKNQK